MIPKKVIARIGEAGDGMRRAWKNAGGLRKIARQLGVYDSVTGW